VDALARSLPLADSLHRMWINPRIRQPQPGSGNVQSVLTAGAGSAGYPCEMVATVAELGRLSSGSQAYRSLSGALYG